MAFIINPAATQAAASIISLHQFRANHAALVKSLQAEIFTLVGSKDPNQAIAATPEIFDSELGQSLTRMQTQISFAESASKGAAARALDLLSVVDAEIGRTQGYVNQLQTTSIEKVRSAKRAAIAPIFAGANVEHLIEMTPEVQAERGFWQTQNVPAMAFGRIVTGPGTTGINPDPSVTNPVTVANAFNALAQIVTAAETHLEAVTQKYGA